MTMQRRQGRALGSPLRLTVVDGADRRAVDRAWTSILAEFAAVDRAMSRFREDSEITTLHRSRDAIAVSRRLRVALALVDRARRVTGGRFDAGVLPDLERLGSAPIRQSWPGARRGTGRRAHELHGRTARVELVAPADLGGVGKGLALRWASRRASRLLGGAGFVLEAGGDIASRGDAGNAPWHVAIEDPSGGTDPIATCLLVPDGAIATSSIRLASWTGPTGRAVHHLIDPRTGEPGGAGLLAVSVAARDPAWAEIWSKALFLEGQSSIGVEARARGLAAWWVDAGGSVSMTPAARQRTTWVRAEAMRAHGPRLPLGLIPLGG